MKERVIVTEVEFRNTATPGGAKVRGLRERRGKTQLWVEMEAELGTGYLQRVESGRVAQPSRATVERILAALQAGFSERREIEESFGYMVSIPVPSDDDLRWAREATLPDLRELTFPAYTLDCTARLVAWNRFLPHLIGLSAGDQLPDHMTRQSMLHSWFDARTPLGGLVGEPDILHPAMLRALRHELTHYPSEPWVDAMIAELCGSLPRFREVWAGLASEPLTVSSTRARVPIRLRLRNGAGLSFRLASEPLTRDSRFRAIHLFPADPETMVWCATIAAQE